MQNNYYLNRSTLGGRGFFLLGATELSGKAAKASREAAGPAPLTLTLLAAGEREDLWHQGYNRSGFLVKEAPPL